MAAPWFGLVGEVGKERSVGEGVLCEREYFECVGRYDDGLGEYKSILETLKSYLEILKNNFRFGCMRSSLSSSVKHEASLPCRILGGIPPNSRRPCHPILSCQSPLIWVQVDDRVVIILSL